MPDPHETLEALKEGNALKIETLQLMKEGAIKTFDAMIAQAHKESATYDELGKEIRKACRSKVSNTTAYEPEQGGRADKNDAASTALRAQDIVDPLRKEILRLNFEYERSIDRYIEACHRAREECKRNKRDADRAPLVVEAFSFARSQIGVYTSSPAMKPSLDSTIELIKKALGESLQEFKEISRSSSREHEKAAEEKISQADRKCEEETEDFKVRMTELEKIIELVEKNLG